MRYPTMFLLQFLTESNHSSFEKPGRGCSTKGGAILSVTFLCARKAWLEGKGEQDVTLKFETGAQRVKIPSRQRLASRREASLARRGVTHGVKRRQRARGPRDRASKVRLLVVADGVKMPEGCNPPSASGEAGGVPPGSQSGA